MRLEIALMILLGLAAVPAAASTLAVEGVVSPAWVERGGTRVPLAVSMRLNDKDRIVTGPGSRALLRMAEGSAVKLGENAALALDDLADKRGTDVARLVTASLDVVRGAFRFTTDKEKPLPVAPVDPKQLAIWAAETEIQPGSGAARRGGRLGVDTAASTDQAAALAAYDHLRAAGYPAVLRPVKAGERVEYRVRIENLPTQRDAAATVEKLKALGLAEAAVFR